MKNEMRLQGIGMVEGTEAGKIQIGDILRWNHGGLSKVISFELSKTGKTINCQVEVINSRTGEKEIYERSMRVTRLVNIVASANTKNDFNLQFEDKAEEVVEAEAEVEAPKTAKILVAWFDYSLDEGFEKEIEDYQLEWLRKQRHIEVEKVEGITEIEASIKEIHSVIIANENKKQAEKKKKEIEYVIKQIEEADDLKQSIHEVSYRVTNHGSYVDIMLFVTDVANDVTLVAQQEGEFKNMEEAETLISYLKKTGNKIEFVETMAYTG